MRHEEPRAPSVLQVNLLTVIGSGGDMVYFIFDHGTFMSKTGILNPKWAGMSFAFRLF